MSAAGFHLAGLQATSTTSGGESEEEGELKKPAKSFGKRFLSKMHLAQPRAHPKARQNLAPETRIAGDTSVLKRHFRLVYAKGRNGAPGTMEYKGRDNFYRPVMMICCLLTLATVVCSFYVLGNVVAPAAVQIFLKSTMCVVQQVTVVATDVTITAAGPDAAGTCVGADCVEPPIAPHKCLYCDKDGARCIDKTRSRGYGYCVQLNVSLEVETETPYSPPPPSEACNAVNLTNSSNDTSSSNMTCVTYNASTDGARAYKTLPARTRVPRCRVTPCPIHLALQA